MIAAYLLFTYMWCITMFYGIWDLKNAGNFDTDLEQDQRNIVWAVCSTLIYTFFFLMMIISHFMTMRTSPG